MELPCTVSEYAATLIEAFTLMFAVALMSEPKYHGKAFWWRACLICLGECVMVSWLNTIYIVSQVTLLAVIFYFILTTAWICRGRLLQRAAAMMAADLVMLATEYLVIVIFGLCIEQPIENWYSFSFLMYPNPLRLLALAIFKAVDVLILIALHKPMRRFNGLPRTQYAVVFIIDVLAYCVMYTLVGMIFAGSTQVTQMALILAFFFIGICAVTIDVAFVSTNHFLRERETTRLLRSTNELLEKNYENEHRYQRAFARQIHDFNKHLSALRRFPSLGDEAAAYIDALLETPKETLDACHSGCEIIDAVINSEQARAIQAGISFEYKTSLPSPLNIDPIDLCSILSNQLDNAIDACRLIPAGRERRIRVKIWAQTERMLFLRVVNTVVSDPFENNPELHSTKPPDSGVHGYGLKNIRATAAKYQGECSNVYRDGVFISVVMLQLPTA